MVNMLLDLDPNKHDRQISESTHIAILSASNGGISQLCGLITMLKFHGSYCNIQVVRHFRTFMVTCESLQEVNLSSEFQIRSDTNRGCTTTAVDRYSWRLEILN